MFVLPATYFGRKFCNCRACKLFFSAALENLELVCTTLFYPALANPWIFRLGEVIIIKSNVD